MKFLVDWRVFDSSDRGTFPIAQGKVEKEHTDANDLYKECEAFLRGVFGRHTVIRNSRSECSVTEIER